jgi:DNA-binding LytR/AlgR family response regulator
MTTILIEDNFNWKIKFLKILDELNITVLGVATTVAESIALFQKHKPDFIVADILLDNDRVFEVFNKMPILCNIPTIFVTVSELEIDYTVANKMSKSLYLVKPIHKLTLKSSINLLIPTSQDKPNTNEAFIEIKGKYNQKVKLFLNKIAYIKQDHHYCSICTEKQIFVLKKSLSKLLLELDENFMQIHRSHVVNKSYIEKFGIGLETLKVNAIDLPIGLTYKNDVQQLIAEKFTLK